MLLLRITHDIVVNPEHIDLLEMVNRTDAYSEPHVLIKFQGGNFLDLPPEITMNEACRLIGGNP
jgi:hypothetical protein